MAKRAELFMPAGGGTRLVAHLLSRRVHARLAALPVLLVFLACGASAVLAQDGQQPSFFKSVERRSSNIASFHKWTDVLARTRAEQSSEHACGPGRADECPYAYLDAFVSSLRADDPWHQLVAVNHEMNKRRYLSDQASWGVEDYWETPGEFIRRGSGDCEDFAIAKYLALRRLGWSPDVLRIAAVVDVNGNIGHAVLVATYRGSTYLLDNQIRSVTETERVRTYVPVYSINETSWWRHQPGGVPVATCAGSAGCGSGTAAASQSDPDGAAAGD